MTVNLNTRLLPSCVPRNMTHSTNTFSNNDDNTIIYRVELMRTHVCVCVCVSVWVCVVSKPLFQQRRIGSQCCTADWSWWHFKSASAPVNRMPRSEEFISVLSEMLCPPPARANLRPGSNSQNEPKWWSASGLRSYLSAVTHECSWRWCIAVILCQNQYVGFARWSSNMGWRRKNNWIIAKFEKHIFWTQHFIFFQTLPIFPHSTSQHRPGVSEVLWAPSVWLLLFTCCCRSGCCCWQLGFSSWS